MILVFSDGSNSDWTVKDAEGSYLNDDQMQAGFDACTEHRSQRAGGKDSEQPDIRR